MDVRSRSEKVLHLEVPRAFTLTIRPPKWSAAAALAKREITLVQRDLNPNHWQALLGPRRLAEVSDFTHPHVASLARIDEAQRHLHAFRSRYSLSFGGSVPSQQVVASSQRLVADARAAAADPVVTTLADIALGQIREHEPTLVSFGITSVDSLHLASALALLIKQAAPGLPLVLGDHHFENFSLVRRVDELIEAGALFEVFDALVLYEEQFAEALISLIDFQRTAEPAQLTNVAVRQAQGVTQHAPQRHDAPLVSSSFLVDPEYLAALPVPATRVVCQTFLTNNRCYYGKCTFCTQIHRHLSPRYLDEPSAVRAAAEAIISLHRQTGVDYFSLLDEAVRPKDFRLFSELLLASGARISWCARAIVDTNLEPELLELMARAGCCEILLGLETSNAETALKMGKVSQRDHAPQLLALIERFAAANIDLVLSLIYDFPSESREEFEATRVFLQECQRRFDHVSYVLNRFSLFDPSFARDAPLQIGIKAAGKRLPGNDLQTTLNYSDDSGRRGFDVEPRPDIAAMALGVSLPEYECALNSGASHGIQAAAELSYGATGLLYRRHARRFLLRDVLASSTFVQP